MFVVIIVAAVLAVMGIIVLVGKGDNLITGYNTASKEERAKYNIKRLRGLIGGLLVAMAPMMLFLANDPSPEKVWSFSSLVLFACIVVLILANTWAKKKFK